MGRSMIRIKGRQGKGDKENENRKEVENSEQGRERKERGETIRIEHTKDMEKIYKRGIET